MKLLTKEIQANLPPIGTGAADPMVWVKFFDPFSFWTWYGIEYDPDNRIFYGYVGGFAKELGDFSLDEFESIARIERDRHFTPCKLSELRKG